MIRFINNRITIILLGVCITIGADTFADEYQYHPKEKEFVKTFIELLPDDYEHKNTIIRECKPKNYDCDVKELVRFAVGYCEMLDRGMSRKDVFKSMGKFFNQKEAIAMVDAGINIFCPNNKNRLVK
jgi:hypothetical protein